jgi:exodeoxyribonuclease V alpha subunit
LLNQWNFLNLLLEKGVITYVDLALANYLLRPWSSAREEVACMLCYLSMAVRQGHFCIAIDEKEIHPKPEELYQSLEDHENHEKSLDAAIWKQFNAYIMVGATILPPELLSDPKRDFQLDTGINALTPICRENNRYYFHRFWTKETALILHLSQMLSSRPEVEINRNEAEQYLQNLLETQKILPEQSQSIFKACEQRLSIICGGPGTGKTYTAAQLIKTIWHCLPDSQKKHFKIALGAPTGKAAANLQKSLSHVMDTLDGIGIIKAQTIHSLLSIGKAGQGKKESARIQADLILIDEGSMIDIDLIVALFKAIKPGARLILLGDPNQLPPVEVGAIFADLADAISPTVLNKCMRSEQQGILKFAAAVNNNHIDQAFAILEQGEIGYQEFGPNFKQKILDLAAPFFRVESENFSSILESFNQFRILSPLRKGPQGLEAINDLFLHYFEKKSKGSFPLITPIILTKNAKELELFNGETGALMKKNSLSNQFEEGDYAIFPGDRPDTIKQIPAILLPSFEYAYCLSVHKSQGSEFEHVLMMLPEGSEVFGSQALYTAATRAKKKLEIWGAKEILKRTLVPRAKRLSGIPYHLRQKNYFQKNLDGNL